jgi:hypothetical protein
MMKTKSIRMSSRERAWLPLEFIRTVGPVAGVDRDGLVNALTGLHAVDPTNPAVCRLDRDNGRWVSMSTTDFAVYAAKSVTAVDGTVGPDELSAMLCAEPRTHHPVRLLVGNGYVALKIAHVYGDADPVNRLLRALILAAAARRAANAPRVHRRHQLTKAVWNQFGKGPSRWRTALRIERPPPTRSLGPADSVAWQPRLACESRRSFDVMVKMRAWRDAHAPGVSTSVITYAAFIGALRHCGVGGHQDGAVFLIDARRYLPKGQQVVDGNFCWGQWLSPVDLTSPATIQKALQAELSSGRILTMMVLRETRLRLGPVQGIPRPYPDRVAADHRQMVTLGNQGRHDLLADLPWTAAPTDRVNHSIPTLCGPQDVTLCTSELSGVLHIDVTYHQTSYDQSTMRRVAELVCADPIGMIMASGGSSGPTAHYPTSPIAWS